MFGAMKTVCRLFYLVLILGVLGGCAGTVTKVGLMTNEDSLVQAKRDR